MDPTTAVRTDTLPAIATVLGPGAFATAPYAWTLLARPSELRTVVLNHEATALTVMVMLWIVAGFAIDSAGSYVEVYWIDRRRPDRDEMLATWWKYLRIAWVHEPVGQHYLRRLLVSFKFELNTFVATSLNIISVVLLAIIGAIPWPMAVGAELFLGVLMLLSAQASRDTSQVLADVRAALVKGVGEPPFDKDGNPAANPSTPFSGVQSTAVR
jgi:hypothetical protein